MAICKQCRKVFEAKMADALYCSDKCRKTLSRTNSDIIPDKVSDLIIPDRQGVTDKPAYQDSQGQAMSTLPDTKYPPNGNS